MLYRANTKGGGFRLQKSAGASHNRSGQGGLIQYPNPSIGLGTNAFVGSICWNRKHQLRISFTRWSAQHRSDNNRNCIHYIRDISQQLELTIQAVQCDVISFLEKNKQPYDWVFMDPLLLTPITFFTSHCLDLKK